MGHADIKTDRAVSDPTAPERADRFALELSDLGRRYGIGVGGSPVLFLLERDDYPFDYSVDGESRLQLGDSEADTASKSGGDTKRRLDSLVVSEID